MTKSKLGNEDRSALDSQYPRFHLAIPVTDLAEARAFYAGVLDCATGRESDRWIDFDFFGHQLVTHLIDTASATGDASTNRVSGENVPASHFGIVMPWHDYEQLLAHLRAQNTAFVIEHHIRFPGRDGEQATFFLKDPSDNHLEFKAFRHIEMLFAKDLGEY